MKQIQIGDYIILEFLGKGASASVYKGYHIKYPNIYVAIKEYYQDSEQLFHNEFKALTYLQGVCQKYQLELALINRLLDVFQYQNQSNQVVLVMVLEYASKGELFQYLQELSVFQQNISNFYCRQIVEAVFQLHTLNVAHRDIKPQNILLDDQFNIKLSDFGVSIDHIKSQLRYDPVGTLDYSAPEILLSYPYDPLQADIFSLGVVLCLIYTSIHPFRCNPCDHTNIYYKTLLGNPNKFWTDIQQQCYQETNEQINVPPEFRDLIEWMLQYHGIKRPTIKEVINHAFFKQECASQDELIKYMENSYQYLQSSFEEELTLQTLTKMIKQKDDKTKFKYDLKLLNPYTLQFRGIALEDMNSLIIQKISTSHSLMFEDSEQDQNCKWKIIDCSNKDTEVGMNLLQCGDKLLLNLVNLKGKGLSLNKVKQNIRKAFINKEIQKQLK